MIGLIFIPSLSFCSLSSCGTSIEDITNNSITIEDCVLDKFKTMNAITYIYVDEPEKRWHHIGSSKVPEDSLLHFGWFEFGIKTYPDKSSARIAFTSLELEIKNHDLKSPEYIFRCSESIFHLRTGCFNEKNLYIIEEIFLSCLDQQDLSTDNKMKVGCGGVILQ